MHELEQWDKEYVWHPFTQMQQYKKEKPLIIERGEGNYLIDIEGNRYLDGYSSLWVNVHGHAHPLLNEALKEQLEKISHSTLLGAANVPSILLAKKLVELTPPGLNKVFYSDSGSTSVEIALKMAYQYWKLVDPVRYEKKNKYISFKEAYHGDTIGSVSVGGMDTFHKIFKPILIDRIEAPTPYVYRMTGVRTEEEAKKQCLDALEAILAEHHEEVAALIIEPLVQGAAGMITHPKGFLSGVRKLCTKYNVLMIADEVAVGFGRTGTMFACEQEKVQPDFLCVAKGITGGYLPLAATVTTNTVYEVFLGEPEELKTFFHGHSYTGNQLACAVALKSIELLESEGFIPALEEKIDRLKSELQNFWKLPYVGDIRQKGMMAGIEIVQNKETKEPFPLSFQVEHRIILEARNRGVIIRPLGPVIVLMPPLSIEIEELQKLAKVTYDAIKAVTESIGTAKGAV
ncbi:adenosylmethionine--8-amino-7-oxononanoate transaminase [Fictibacillus sp. Mic-4]|uniref:adenosylmethionine--8-amino-7-oxononanoate transaminase n=1 Tax=Fictibacillus TaxID=1329200 RepID=UPI000552D65A|nr:adenosylmethionine--8-amino-7-oxononanoate transaminase [Fictibacillus gelatini]